MVTKLAVLSVLISLALIALVATSVQANGWSSAVTTGLTTVESVFQNGTYTWTLTNLSSLPTDTEPDYDILIWSLIPYQVEEPLTVSTPQGWRWTGGGWEVSSSNQKYYTSPAVGPGQSLIFQYTPDPDAPMINDSGPQPEGMSFLTHVAAVVPNSGLIDGSAKWQPTTTEHGGTWFDRAQRVQSPSQATPEPSGVCALLFGIAALGAKLKSRKRDFVVPEPEP